MNQLPTLLKRELWEHRGMFVVLPTVITAFICVALLILLLMVQFGDVNFLDNVETGSDNFQLYTQKIAEIASLPLAEREQMLMTAYHSISAPLMFVLWLIVLFYLMGSLYEERKDRSILFWKSMPVSDALTVISKLVAATIMAPLIYLAFVVAINLMLLLTASLAAMGSDADIFEALWRPSNLMSYWFSLLVIVLLQSLWSLPVFGWILLVSASVRSLPLVWIIGVPVGISILGRIVTGQSVVSDWIKAHVLPRGYGFDQHTSLAEFVGQSLSPGLIVAVVIGVALLAAAVYMRGKTNEI
jgi:ABC-2 type transport system permease protein